MEVTESRGGGTTTLRISGRVDSSVSKILQERVQDIVSRDEHIIVDLGGMSYVSSAGLRSFIMLAKHAKAPAEDHRAGRHAGGGRSRSSRSSGLLDLFPVHGTMDDAVAALPR